MGVLHEKRRFGINLIVDAHPVPQLLKSNHKHAESQIHDQEKYEGPLKLQFKLTNKPLTD